VTENTNNLGRLEAVDLRTVWTSEAGDFTPWLANEDNLALLGDTIGLELELEAQEKNVGPFRADILCRDTDSDGWVLIENQLERTNHTHLGQLITYAAGLDAVTIVWVADQFSDEHRAALDWLNEITGEQFRFFGLEIELWRIGDSMTAPKFNIVSKPNDWTKGSGPRVKTEDGSRLEYWKSFRELVVAKAPELQPRKPRDKAALRFSTGRRRIEYRAQAARVKGGHVSVGLAVRGKQAPALFAILKQDRATIETELGVPVEWIEQATINTYHLRTSKPAQPDNRAEWPQQHQWLLDNLRLFTRVLTHRIAALPRAEDLEAEADDGDEDEDD